MQSGSRAGTGSISSVDSVCSSPDDVYLVCANHSYQSRDQVDLTFEAGEHFLVLEPAAPDAKWIHVITEVGQTGYAPCSYVDVVKTTTANIVDFLEGCMEAIQLNAVQRGGVYSSRERSLLQVLSQKRKCLVEPMILTGSVASTSISSVSLASSTATSSSYASSYTSSYPHFAEVGSSQATLSSTLGGTSVSGRSVKKPPAPKPPPRSPNTSLNSIPNEVQAQSGSLRGHPAMPAVSYLDVASNAPDYYQAPSPQASGSKQASQAAHNETSTETLVNGAPVSNSEPVSRQEPSVDSYEKRHLTGLCYELVEAVRVETNLSHAGSRQAVAAVLKKLGESMRKLGPDLFPLVDHLEECGSLSPELIAESRDAVKLRNALNELVAARLDEQQRGWHLHEDEAAILSSLDSVLDTMGGADLAVTRYVVSEDNYSRIVDLVVYFQMETRRSIRLKVLETLNLLCALEPKVIPVLLSSVLPLELIRDILASEDDRERASRCVILLATILSLGDKLPVHYFEQITPKFLEFIMKNVLTDQLDEDPLAEGLQIHCFILLLGLNLQYPNPDANPVLAALKNVSHAPVLTARLLLHFNRGEDPLDLVDVDGPRARPDSVTKLLTDMFSDEKTSYLFYTNDVNAMMDMIIRNLTDLPEDDPGKEPYFRLLLNVLIQTSYEDNLHRMVDIHRCLRNAVHSEKSTLDTRFLAQAICDRFPKLFPM